MSSADIIRAWKDPEYRSTLSVVPIHPAGQIELADSSLSGRTRATRGFGGETRENRTHDFCHPDTKSCTLNFTSVQCCK